MQTFWKLNPKIMYVYQDAYIEQKKQEMKMLDISAYYNGMYVQRAIASCFSKNAKYPEKPLLIQKQMKEEIEQEKELTEEQKMKYQKQLLMQLQIMQSNFETGKKSKE